MRVGIFDHFGWAVAVTASSGQDVVDRRRVELPMHYDSPGLDEAGTAALVDTVRASITRATTAAFDELEAALPASIASVSLRSWPADFPTDVAVLRRPPYESRADAVMYREILADLARGRGWNVQLYDAKTVIAQAVVILGDRADDVLQGPRARLGAPWTKDHRVALAATIVAG
jgi:hypothetical protein